MYQFIVAAIASILIALITFYLNKSAKASINSELNGFLKLSLHLRNMLC